MKPDYWRIWELRTALLDGVAAFMESRLLFWVAVAQAALLVPISLGVWFLGRCVFLDTWQSHFVCDPYPAIGTWGWFAYSLALLAFTWVYVFVHRATLRRGWLLRIGSLSVKASTLLALAVGWQLGKVWAGFMPGVNGTSSFGELVNLLTPPSLVWLSNTHFTLWTIPVSKRGVTRDQGVALVVRMLIHRYLRLRSPIVVDVTCRDDTVTVRGPVDAIDTRRIEDIVGTRLPERLSVEVSTTLGDEAYWAAYRAELGRTGFGSRPIRHPRGIPVGIVVGLLVVGVVAIIVAFRYGPGLSPGITAEDLAGFYGIPIR